MVYHEYTIGRHGITDTYFTIECVEQLMVKEDIERLTREKAKMLTELKGYEEDLKLANECELHDS